MTINTDLNTFPYFDDYDKTKGFYRILFRPGYAVQARELTQLQTSLQNQIESVGSHIFKNGSVVLGGNSFFTKCNYFDPVNASGEKISSAVAKTLIGRTISAANGFIGEVFFVNDNSRVYYITKTGVDLQRNQIIVTPDAPFITVYTKDVEAYFGAATRYAVEESIYYVGGFFVYSSPQSIIVGEDNPVFSCYVGFNTTEKILTSDEDVTLLDPSQGSFNFAAPGADRYSISLDLGFINYDPTNENKHLVLTDTFIETGRFEYGALVEKTVNSEYSQLEKNLARRTFDESGDYTTVPFKAQVVENIFTADDDFLTMVVAPGKAYVKGFEFETIAPVRLNFEKARDIRRFSDYPLGMNIGGTLFYVSAVFGNIDFTTKNTVNLLNTSEQIIGSCSVRHIEHDSTVDTVEVYRIYLEDIVLTGSNSFKDIAKLISGAFSASIELSYYAGGIVTADTTYPNNLVSFNTKFIQTFVNSSSMYDINFFYDKKLTTTLLSTAGIASASLNSGSLVEFFLGSGVLSSNQVNSNYYAVVTSSSDVDIPVGTVLSYQKGFRITVNPNQTSFSASIATASNIGVIIYARTSISEVEPKQKVLNTATETFTAAQVLNNVLTLQQADGFSLTNVTLFKNLVEFDVTSRYTFNGGQKDSFYDLSAITRVGDLPISDYTSMEVTYTYFEHSGDGFFNVDSYGGSGLEYSDIPEYKSNATGEVFSLRDSVDFRPRKLANGTFTNNGKVAIPQSIFTSDFSHYLPRIDKLVLTKERKFDVVKGISGEKPVPPADLPDAMSLYILRLDPFTTDPKSVSLSYIDNRRYTMRDIARIDKRVERVEYYTTLSLLEKQAADEQYPSNVPGIDRFKNGILVDSFAGHSVGNITSGDYACAIDFENRILRPKFDSSSFNFKLDSATGVVKRGDLITLSYTQEALINQPFASRTVNLNPYSVYSWNGVLTLTPATDTWIDTTQKPDVVINLNGENDIFTRLTDFVPNAVSGTKWNDWQTVIKGVTSSNSVSNSSSSTSTAPGSNSRLLESTIATTTTTTTTTSSDILARAGLQVSSGAVNTITTDLGNKVVDFSLAPFIRARDINFYATGMKPNARYSATFDGYDVTTYCEVADEIKVTSVNPLADEIRNADATKTASIVGKRAFRFYTKATKGTFEIGDTFLWFRENTQLSATPATITDIDNSGVLLSNDIGDIAGIFKIPDQSVQKFKAGEKIFRLADSLDKNSVTSAAEFKYIASGFSQSVEKNIVATRVQQVALNPLLGFDSISTTSTNNDVTSTTTTVDVTPAPPIPPPITQTFSLYADRTSVLEGGVAKFTLDTTNVANGTNYSYVITGVSQTDIGSPLSGNLQVINNTASLSIPIRQDSLVEAQETLRMRVIVGGGRADLNAQTIITSLDVTPTYSLKVSKSVLTDGASYSVPGSPPVDRSTVVTFETTGVAPGTQFAYTITGSVDSTDLLYPLTGFITVQPASNPITSNGAQACEAVFQIGVRQDATVENTENAIISITTPQGVVSKEIVIIDGGGPVPTYTLNSNKSTINEGEAVIFTLNTTNVTNGTVFNYVIRGTGITTGDITTPLTGTITVTGNTGSATITTVLDASNEESEILFFDVIISATKTLTAQVNILNFATPTAPAVRTYVLSQDKGSISETQTVTFTLTTTNVTNGTTIPYTISGVSNTDINVSRSGNFVVNSNTASLAVTALADALVEGTEILTITAITPEGNLSRSVQIVDTTPVAQFVLSQNKGHLIEGDTVTFTLTVTGDTIPNGTTYPYRVSGVSASDITGPLSGVLTITGNTASIVITTVRDNVTEGNENLNFAVDVTYGGIFRTYSASVVIQDYILVPTFVLSATPSEIFEGQTVIFTLTTTNVPPNSPVAFTLSTTTEDGTIPVIFQHGGSSVQYNNSFTGTFYTQGSVTNYPVTILQNSFFNGVNDQTISMKLTGYPSLTTGTLITKTVQISDVAPVQTVNITVNNKTPNRTQESVWRISTSNVADLTELPIEITLYDTTFDFKQQIEYIEFTTGNRVTRLIPNGLLTVNGVDYSRLGLTGALKFNASVTIIQGLSTVKIKTKYDALNPSNLFPNAKIEVETTLNGIAVSDNIIIGTPAQQVGFTFRSDRGLIPEGESVNLTLTTTPTYGGEALVLNVYDVTPVPGGGEILTISTDFVQTFPLAATVTGNTATITLTTNADALNEGTENKRAIITSSPSAIINAANTPTVNFSIRDAVTFSSSCISSGGNYTPTLSADQVITQLRNQITDPGNTIIRNIMTGYFGGGNVIGNTTSGYPPYLITYPIQPVPVAFFTPALPTATNNTAIFNIPGAVGGTAGGGEFLIDAFTFGNTNNPGANLVIDSLTIVSTKSSVEVRANLKATCTNLATVTFTNPNITVRYRPVAGTGTFQPITCTSAFIIPTINGNDISQTFNDQYDPVAQTFYVSPTKYPNGLFLSSVDLYFAQKVDSESVYMQIRPVENGFPSSSKILPFAIVEKEGALITTSLDGTVATNFEFESPVYLSPGEYAFVAIANSTNFEIYTATIGDFLIDAPDTRITEQPYIGSMFKSQNASTWTPVQEEDVKFKLNFCTFTPNLVGTSTLNISNDSGSDILFDTFYMGGEILDFASTNLDSFYKTRDINGSSTTFVPYQYESNENQSIRKIARNGEPTDLQARFEFMTKDKYISPVMDLSRLSTVLIANIINSDYALEDQPAGGNAIARYLTKTVKLTPGFEANDLRVTFDAKRPVGSDVRVFYKASTIYDPSIDDKSWTEMVLEYGEPVEGKYVEYRYKTADDTVLGEDFAAFSVKLVMLSTDTTKVPEITDLRVVALDA